MGVRGGEAGARESAQLPALCAGGHHRLAGRDRGEPRAVRHFHGAVCDGWNNRSGAAIVHADPRASPADDVLRPVVQSRPGLFQPDSDPPARWQPCVLPSAPAGCGDAVPATPALRISADHADQLHAAGCRSVLPVACVPAPPPRPRHDRAGRASERAAAPMTGPSMREQAGAGFVVELEKFSGPLDLLLHLIKEDEVDITDLPIAKIADQFLSVIAELGLNQAADYLEMAARLLRIKAQMLLPRRLGDDEWEDPRAELVRRLLEYQQIHELVDWLGHAADARAERFGRGYEAPPPDALPAPLQIDLNDLLAAAERVISLIPEPMLHRVVPRPLDVEGATARILALLAERETFGWRDAVGGPQASLVDVLSTFIALLELAKRSSLTLSQPEPFGPMVITRALPHEAA
ncbi:MAG: hypothetical protein DMD58_11490 [Gemmatimonadetes bacterium]|nr:MAG: hypothetical protein DMD58_11490 [Gemmatimonadota bacterium]